MITDCPKCWDTPCSCGAEGYFVIYKSELPEGYTKEKILSVVSEFEAKLTNAEQLTCEECANNSYLDCPCFDYSNGIDPIIQYCSEYKPKDTQ